MKDTNLTTPVVQLPKINWLLFSLMGIVVLIAGISIGFLVGKYIYTPKPTPTPLLSPTPQAKPDPAQRDTANWKTYTNVKYGFELKYPNPYEAKEEINPNYLLLVNLNKNQNSVFNISVVTYTKTLDDYLNSQYCVPNGPCSLSASAKSSTSLALPSGIMGKYFRPPSEGLPTQTFISKMGNYIYNITYIYQEQSIPAGLDPFLDQILSTFKFVEQTSDVSNLKTYINNKCQYQISYPDSWSLFPEPEKAIYGVTLLVSYGNEKKPNDNNWLKAQIGCGAVSAGDSPRQTIDKLNARDSGYGVPKVEFLGQTTVNDKIAYKQIVTATVGDPVLEYYIFADDTSFVNIGFTPSTSKLSAEMQQIVSSFMFIK